MRTFLLVIFILYSCFISGQGCSDAGVCTAGDFSRRNSLDSHKFNFKQEAIILLTYATHGKNERFFQPQLNYRVYTKNRSNFEFKLPVNRAWDKNSNQTHSGIGDLTLTYNRNTTHLFDYTLGLRVSLSSAAAKAPGDSYSYPMYLQAGLGTTDLLAVLNYNAGKYFSIGTGLQIPFLQYNQHQRFFSQPAGPALIGDGYRRKADALLRIAGHYGPEKLKLNMTVLAIFHLAEDHYKSTAGKIILTGSKGTTLNAVFEMNYDPGRKWAAGFLYASPFKTRKNIPDGLARTAIISPRLTYRF